MSFYPQYGFNGFGGSFPGTMPWGGQYPGQSTSWNGFGGFTPFAATWNTTGGNNFGFGGVPFGGSTPFNSVAPSWGSFPFFGWNSGNWNNPTNWNFTNWTPFNFQQTGWNQTGWNPAGWNQGVPFGAMPFGWWNQFVPQNISNSTTEATSTSSAPAYPYPFGGFNPFFAYNPQVNSNGAPVTKAA